ncbi:TPA: hypothetical protein N0F65_009306 [Lagenidium giganteum]|uniref:Phosphatidylinositol 3-kinase n=1 Tax=Lagenidium giganteum TaxID=4803 RepID=A0AAV2YLY5_9STRA|nr:TPA: hypothetical protein N0F65_009306 [Lagenidium giganteum]
MSTRKAQCAPIITTFDPPTVRGKAKDVSPSQRGGSADDLHRELREVLSAPKYEHVSVEEKRSVVRQLEAALIQATRPQQWEHEWDGDDPAQPHDPEADEETATVTEASHEWMQLLARAATQLDQLTRALQKSSSGSGGKHSSSDEPPTTTSHVDASDHIKQAMAFQQMLAMRLREAQSQTATRKEDLDDNNASPRKRAAANPLACLELPSHLSDEFDQRRTDRSIKASLLAIPMFQSLTDEQLSSLSNPRNYARKTFLRHELIIRQFDVGHTLYLLVDGAVTIWKKSDAEHRDAPTRLGQLICTLQAGASFGERALLSNGIRTASVRAEATVHCIAIHKDAFEDVLAEITTLHDGYVPDKAQMDQTRTLSNHVREFVDTFQVHAPTALLPTMDPQEERLALEFMAISSPELQVDDVIERMIRALQNYFQVEKLGLFLINHAAQTMLLRVSKDARGILLPIQGIAGHTALTGEMVNVQDAYADARFDSAVDKKTGQRTRQLLCVPVFAPDAHEAAIKTTSNKQMKPTVLGVLQCVNRLHAEAFTPEDEKRLQCAARQLGVVLQQSAQARSQTCLLSYDLITPFTVQLTSLTVALGLRSNQAWPMARATVSVRLFHGREQMMSAATVANASVTLEERTATFIFDSALSLPTARLCDLPVATRVIFEFTIHHGVSSLRRRISKRASLSTTLSIGDLVNDTSVTTTASSSSTTTSAATTTSASSSTANASVDDLVLCGWCGYFLYSYDNFMQSGDLRLGAWMHKKYDPSMPVTALQSTESPCALNVRVARWPKAVVHGAARVLVTDAVDSAIPVPTALSTMTSSTSASEVALERAKVAELTANVFRDPFHRLTPDECAWIWRLRRRLVDNAAALPWFLLAVKWHIKEMVEEAYQYLYMWEPLSPEQAIRLLGPRFPDPKVRAYALQSLEKMAARDIGLYMLQLVQAVRHERFHDSTLARFLLRHALREPLTLGHQLYWFLKAEMAFADVHHRYGVLLDTFLRFCSRAQRIQLGHQVFVLKKLADIAQHVKRHDSVDDMTSALRDKLHETLFPNDFVLPLDATQRLCGVVVDQCRVLGSKQKPLYLVFRRCQDPAQSDSNTDDEQQFLHVLYKSGDDLRQDQLVLQLFRVMDRVWRRAGLDLGLVSYGCVATGRKCGMIEVVKDSETVANLFSARAQQQHGFQRGTPRHKLQSALGILTEQRALEEWLLLNNVPSLERQQSFERLQRDSVVMMKNPTQLLAKSASQRISYSQVVDNFARSCAASCVATYVLGVGDRHNDNIMLSRHGKLFHIDFGHILGNFKKKFGLKRERTMFVFTPAFASVLLYEPAPNSGNNNGNNTGNNNNSYSSTRRKSVSCKSLPLVVKRSKSSPSDDSGLAIATTTKARCQSFKDAGAVNSPRRKWQTALPSSLRAMSFKSLTSLSCSSTSSNNADVLAQSAMSMTMSPRGAIDRARARYSLIASSSSAQDTKQAPAAFALFTRLACDAYNELRHHVDLLYDLCTIMTSGGIPELQSEDDLRWLQQQLLLHENDEHADLHFQKLIKQSLSSRTTLLNDAAHMLKHG